MFVRSFRFRPADIDAALAEGQFRVTYQPQMRVGDRTLIRAEAFVRWRHPEFGTIPPGLFLDFLAEHGRMPDLTRRILDDALSACAQWQAEGAMCGVSVNVSLADLREASLCDNVAEALTRHGIAAPLLTLELPHTLSYLGPNRRIEERPRRHAPDRRADTVTARAWSEIQGVVSGLRALGVRVALDGTADALSTLEMFAPHTFDTVKIGATAIRHLVEGVLGTGDSPLSRARLRFVAEQGIETVAMGVEDARTLRTVADLGFTAAQGRLIGHPAAAASLPDWTALGVAAALAAEAGSPALRAPQTEPVTGRKTFGQRQRAAH
ncbi:EAL domain-containing protein [Futiania mangrovi]|uniref:EAL domain-containing protein n=1 Tax=Futiania mangrovi TaxID=2959716 RepID=A0A9J6PEM7_9PROT|nr:EAL domain-containing protein [Futiania mangrovii]MCP1335079.1 EAL domain-containing protein [Futiania mangrovii]